MSSGLDSFATREELLDKRRKVVNFYPKVANYTITEVDLFTRLVVSDSTIRTVTLPIPSLSLGIPRGAWVEIYNGGSVAVTVAAGAGASLKHAHKTTIYPGDTMSCIYDGQPPGLWINEIPYGTWQLIGSNGPAFQTGYSDGGVGIGMGAVGFRFEGNNTVRFRGQVQRTSGAGASPFTLPAEYRPVSRRLVLYLVGGAGAVTYLDIPSTGVITPSGVVTSGVYMDGCTYSIRD